MTFGENWRNAADEKIEPPRGTYNVKITGGSAFTSRDGDDYAKVDLEILDGDLQGSRFEHFMGFKHPVGARINREALLAYGLQGSDEIGTVDELHEAILQLAGRTSEVGVSYKDGYMQIRVSGSRAPEGQTSMSDIPSNGFTSATKQDFAPASGSGDDEPIPF